MCSTSDMHGIVLLAVDLVCLLVCLFKVRISTDKMVYLNEVLQERDEKEKKEKNKHEKRRKYTQNRKERSD